MNEGIKKLLADQKKEQDSILSAFEYNITQKEIIINKLVKECAEKDTLNEYLLNRLIFMR